MNCPKCDNTQCRQAARKPSLKYYSESKCKMMSFDWLGDIELPEHYKAFDIIEVSFKNSRKEFFINVNNLDLEIGEMVAVEASPGHAIGYVTLKGELVRSQMKIKNFNPAKDELKKVYRKVRPADVEKYHYVRSLEEPAKYKTRLIAKRLKLSMKINDVEYQGDGTKAVFYYTAEDRVDFRELIRLLAEEFKVRIEMRQIGARQESSRLGGIGSCGRELCCGTFISNFRSVSTNTARVQQLSLNPQKLAGQCSKLKCCLNFEHDIYLDAIKDFPDTTIHLKTKNGDAVHQKTDVFGRTMYYSYLNELSVHVPLTIERVKEIQAMNRRKQIPDKLDMDVDDAPKRNPRSEPFQRRKNPENKKPNEEK
ncbi:MAG: regulatory iron-sulfur-containing complex subunit RicT [Bacteroidota bacterium]